MAMNSTQKIKALRVQGSRSRTGCQTCKLKHVKCDEAAPVCGRCARNKRPCHYEDQGNATSAAGSKFVVYTIPKPVEPTLKLPSHDNRALWHFQYRTLRQVEGPFKTELWSTIVPRLIQTDSIVRQAVMALSSLHEHYLGQSPVDPSLPDRALMYYQKARQQIISLESPDASFDSVLCASIIFSACEGLRGNFDTATQHAVAGLKMIAGRSTVGPHTVTMLTASKRTLFDVFMDLQSQVLEANEDGFNAVYPAVEEEMLIMPDRFESLEQAVSHIQILINQVFDLYQSAEEHHETNPWIPSQISPALQPVYEAICTQYHMWENAVSQLENMVDYGDDRQRAAFILLQIFGYSYKIYLYVFVHGEDTYDDLIQTNYHILSLAETYLHIHSDTSSPKSSTPEQDSPPSATSKPLPSSFNSYPGVIPVIFEIATRTNDATLSQKAIQLLRYSNKREGIWDGQLAASLAEKLDQLRQEGEMAAATHRVGYKFLITDIQLLSERRYLIRSGFKRIQPGSFDSWWMEAIPPDQGTAFTQIITLP